MLTVALRAGTTRSVQDASWLVPEVQAIQRVQKTAHSGTTRPTGGCGRRLTQEFDSVHIIYVSRTNK